MVFPSFKKYYLDYLIVFLLVVINLFWLPSTSFWTINSQDKTKKTDSKYQPILDYQHPLIPVVINSNTVPSLQAESYILIDATTNTVLSSKNPHSRIYPASITKLATALTALNIYPLDEVVTVNQKYSEGKIMNLVVGEKITIKSLITALLVYSANDAAYNLASHHTSGVEGFIHFMNQIAQTNQLNDTHFTNYDGLHSPEHYSSAYDLSQIGRLAMRNDFMRQVVRQKELILTDITGNIKHHIISTDELLGVAPEIEGFKTGWTPEAGECFLGLINLNGHYLISVVAKSPNRFSDTKQLIDWSKKNIVWQEYK